MFYFCEKTKDVFQNGIVDDNIPDNERCRTFDEAVESRAAGLMDLLKCKLVVEKRHPEEYYGKGCLFYVCGDVESVRNSVLFVPDRYEENDWPFVIYDRIWELDDGAVHFSPCMKALLEKLHSLAEAEGIELSMGRTSYFECFAKRVGEEKMPIINIGWNVDSSFTYIPHSDKHDQARLRINVMYRVKTT